MIEVTTFRWVPPFARGLVRDLRVRWALEEAGLPYQVKQIGFEDKDAAVYRALQPFGQVPVLEEDGRVMFESGAIVLHIAERSEVLAPADRQGWARTTAWVIAALNSVEPAVQNLAAIDLFYADQPWAQQGRATAEHAATTRLAEVADWLDGRDYLEDRFTAGDLMMTSVLRALRHTDLVAKTPGLQPYLDRCEARPAFQKALADQLACFADPAPAPAPAM